MLANILTLIRLMLAFTLLLLIPLSPAFLVVVIICFITDFLDGYVARKTFTDSELGAALDSISDGVFALILIYCLLVSQNWDWWMIVWISAIIVIKIAALVIGYIRFGKPAFVHTYMNKATTILLYVSPFLLFVLPLSIVMMAVGLVASIATVEYLYINCTSKDYVPDRISILSH